MNFTLIRKKENFLAAGIFGELRGQYGNLFAVTLEHAYVQADGTYLPKVPPGVYRCERYASPHFGYDVFRLIGVPDHDYIEIHVGNFNANSEGCILIGDNRVALTISGSRDAFDRFMKTQTNINEFQLSVENQ